MSHGHSQCGGIVRLSAAIAALVLGLGSLATRAQFVEVDSARISLEEFQWQVEQLDATPHQRKEMEIAYARYAAEYDAAKQVNDRQVRWVWSHTDAYHSWYDGRPREQFVESLSAESRRANEEWEKVRQEIEGRYFDRLAVIAAGRDDDVESFKRHRLRFMSFNDDRVYEDRGWEVDLIDIVRSKFPGLMDEPDVRAAMTDYELALHQVLLDLQAYRAERDAVWRRFRAERMAIEAAGGDTSANKAGRRVWLVRGQEMVYRLRSIQQRHAARILAAVRDETIRIELEEAYHVALWAMLAKERALTPEIAFSEALARRDLSTSQRERLDAARQAFRQKRRHAAAGFERPYLDLHHPDHYDAYWRLLDSGENDAAQAVFTPQSERWQRLSEAWKVECANMIGEVKAICAEAGSEASP